ncbi:MAG: hypothetical protein KME45_05075 [Stenomitos rutilans HA7619-LM2]|nr:hypothetical protein [Stenomitos rutilans HA7619-LM2]
MEAPVFNVLVLVAFGLMVIISGGVGYLTLAEWRDRRRRDRASRDDRAIPRSTEKPSRKSGNAKK